MVVVLVIISLDRGPWFGGLVFCFVCFLLCLFNGFILLYGMKDQLTSKSSHSSEEYEQHSSSFKGGSGKPG